MELNSALFILVFLPVVVICNAFLLSRMGKKISVIFIIMSSLLFYFINCKECLVFFLVSIFSNYIVSILISRFSTGKLSKIILIFGILMNISELIGFKYINMITDSCNLIFKTSFTITNIIIPLGISFICFQQIAYLVDVYKTPEVSYSFLDYVNFISFFPHITAGPIVQKKDWEKSQFDSPVAINYDKLSQGLFLFSLGLGKKVLIADVFGRSVNWCYQNLDSINSTDALFVSLAYTLQIYYDFSGYCDMAMGVAEMLQFDLPINFNSPYKATTIMEFWKRWHMTLTGFFTKYLYIPLGGNKKGLIRTIINTMIVFTISGLWHGASYTFIAWGILHGVGLVIAKLFNKQIQKLPKVLNWMITFLFVDFAWILFRANSFSYFKKYMGVIKEMRFDALSQGITEPFILLENIKLLSEVSPWIHCVIFTVVVMVATVLMDNAYEMSRKFRGNAITAIVTVAIAFLSLVSMAGVTTFVYQLF